MRCLRCGFENREGVRFFEECGGKLGPDGDLYVSQFGPGPGPPFLPGWATPGAVVRVDAGTKAISPVYSALSAPGGITVDDDGTIFVTNNSTSIGTGQIIRIKP